MTLLKFIIRTCRGLVVATIAMALLSGACNAGLIALVNVALTQTSPAGRGMIWAFVALGLGKVVSLFFSQAVLAGFSQKAVSELRRDLIKKILAVPLRDLENLGTPRILAALTDDVFNVTQALLAVPVIAVNAAILLGGAIYLGFLSWKILASIGVVIAAGALGYLAVISSALRFCRWAREEEDKLFGYFRALTDGIKELKLHRNRRGAFFSGNIEAVTAACQRHNVSAEVRFAAAQSWSHLLYFALIGLILFLAPSLGTFSSRTLTGFVVTTLYLMGPLQGVLSSFSLFGRARVALQKVQDLGVSLAERSTEQWDAEKEAKPPQFERLELRDVVHSYHREQDDTSFVLGPVNMSFQPGETVFLVGGNGSGKSTLAKIVTGLYLPEQGEIRLDGRPVTNENRDAYRQLFSAVFADFFVFDNLLGLEGADLDGRAALYLEQLHLNHKVRITNGALSTTSVSTGQRKRLALLTAYLEDRPFYLFDEWASDQDPYFKNIFYTKILPDLKARGKTILVITHDDRYFDQADRIIKLDYGKVTSQDVNGTTSEPVHVFAG
ncbi:MAG TPA: cyclic peptide export ABC transporter [Verrucomicrobiae bacterium]|jgi:putative ATP-binding cassette transporter|nr:cyclic peptide export ABC transporter [Verrucomicrobiae bacterium]